MCKSLAVDSLCRNAKLVFDVTSQGPASALRLSSCHRKRARKASCMCLPENARMTIIQGESYCSFRNEVGLIIDYRCGKFSCRDNSTLIVFLCQTIVTLHQGQDYRNEYEHA